MNSDQPYLPPDPTAPEADAFRRMLRDFQLGGGEAVASAIANQTQQLAELAKVGGTGAAQLISLAPRLIAQVGGMAYELPTSTDDRWIERLSIVGAPAQAGLAVIVSSLLTPLSTNDVMPLFKSVQDVGELVATTAPFSIAVAEYAPALLVPGGSTLTVVIPGFAEPSMLVLAQVMR